MMFKGKKPYDKRKFLITWLAIVVLSFILVMNVDVSEAVETDGALKDVQEPKTISVDTQKNGLVEIVTGMVDGDSFKSIKQCNGFIVSNTDGGTYIVTTNKGVQLSDKERENANVSDNAQKSIRVIVRGDVSAELKEVNSSKEKDFCILQSESVIKEKSIVSLNAGMEIRADDNILVVGFPSRDDSAASMQYDARDAEIHTGKIKNIAKVNEGTFINHTGIIRDSSDGSMLINEAGYVIGLNSTSKSSDNTYVSTSITEIASILDNYGIPYSSDVTENLYKQLYDRCKEAEDQIQHSGYKAESKEGVTVQLENAITVLKEMPYNIEKLTEANELMRDAQKKLKRKPNKLFYIMGLLGIVIIILLARFIKLFMWRRAHVDDLIDSNNEKKVKRTNKKMSKPSNNIGSPHDGIAPEHTEAVKRTKKGEGLKSKEISKTPVLYWNRQNMDIKIDRDEFVIGRDSETTHLTIGDNKTVGRKHAVIKKTPAGYLLVDSNSANGTYVNDEVVYYQGQIIKSGDLIRFANEEFVFELK